MRSRVPFSTDRIIAEGRFPTAENARRVSEGEAGRARRPTVAATKTIGLTGPIQYSEASFSAAERIRRSVGDKGTG